MALNTVKAVKRPVTSKRVAVSPDPVSSTKKQKLIALLQQKDGHSVGALSVALGWLPHTVRAALTGLRKSGFSVEQTKEGRLAGRYRIIADRSK